MSNQPSLIPGTYFFRVDEIPSYQPCGNGEHLYLHIQKEGWNTAELATKIAKICQVSKRAVSFAGRKDRHAITTQWFSVHFGKEDHLNQLEELEGITILQVTKHKNKLKTGHLRGNRFRLGISHTPEHIEALTKQTELISQQGMPNRFGSQRFGFVHDGVPGNIRIARALAQGDYHQAVSWAISPDGSWTWGQELPSGFLAGDAGRMLAALRKASNHADTDAQTIYRKAGKNYHQLIASAAQSTIFNAVLDERIKQDQLHTISPGTICQTQRGGQFQVSAEDLSDCQQRAQAGDLIDTGPLPGYSMMSPSNEKLAQEQSWSEACGITWDAFNKDAPLASHGERRPLLVRLLENITLENPSSQDLEHYSNSNWSWLTVSLPRGSFATELLDCCGIVMPEKRHA